MKETKLIRAKYKWKEVHVGTHDLVHGVFYCRCGKKTKTFDLNFVCNHKKDK